MNRVRKIRWERLRFEFWPVYIFYLPCIPVWLFYAIRSLDFWYFLKVNPNMELGGFMQYSKFQVLEGIPEKYKLKTYYKKINEIDSNQPPIPYPFVCKPDFGERGLGVEIIQKETDLLKCRNSGLGPNYIVQEFCDSEMEFGVLYHRFPNGESNITSVVQKVFLSIIGDGKSTFEELITGKFRARKRISHLKEKYEAIWNTVIPSGEKIVVEKVGNHCRGTIFIDRRNLISPELVATFDEIARKIPGFHYGRFDLKIIGNEPIIKSDNIRIFELNGVNSEAAHIYDPDMSIIQAYKSIFKEFNIVFRISQELAKQKKERQPMTRIFFKSLYRHLRRTSL